MIAAVSCGPSNPSTTQEDNSGSNLVGVTDLARASWRRPIHNTGGTTTVGGATSSGGKASTGGATGAGGGTSSGGATSAGGAPSTGGAARTGGSTGGIAGTGGVASTGGSTGGVTGTGGVASSGGSSSAGGSSAGTTTGTGTSGPITATLVASRASGYAPLAVHFDATGSMSTSAGISDLAQGGTFRQIKHAFNFGDPNSGTHSISGLSKNSEPSGAGLAAHVYDTPGTYVVKVTSTDGSGSTATASVTITVNDPSVLTTYAISKTGSFTGAPAGATHLTQSTLPTFASNCRYFFNRGETWPGVAIGIQDPLSNVHIDAYGTGAKPIFDSVGVGSSRPLTSAFATDIRVSNIALAVTGPVQNIGSRILFYKVDSAPAAGIGATWIQTDQYMNIAQSKMINSHEIYFVDCQLLGPTNPSAYVLYGNASRMVFLNTYMGGVNLGTARLTGVERGVIRHCRVESPYTGSSFSAMKLHSGGPNVYDDNWLTSGGANSVTAAYINWMTSKVVLANNIFGGGNSGAAIANWTISVCPQNDGYGVAGAEPLQDIIVENNNFVHAPAWSSNAGNLDIAWRGKRMTSRGNVVSQGSGALLIGLGHEQSTDFDGPYFTN